MVVWCLMVSFLSFRDVSFLYLLNMFFCFFFNLYFYSCQFLVFVSCLFGSLYGHSWWFYNSVTRMVLTKLLLTIVLGPLIWKIAVYQPTMRRMAIPRPSRPFCSPSEDATSMMQRCIHVSVTMNNAAQSRIAETELKTRTGSKDRREQNSATDQSQ